MLSPPSVHPMDFSLDLNVVLQGGALAALLYIVKLLAGMSRWQIETSIILTGKSGANGLVGDVKALTARANAQSEQIHVTDGKAAVLTIRVDRLEGDVDDQRSGEDRRANRRGGGVRRSE